MGITVLGRSVATNTEMHEMEKAPKGTENKKRQWTSFEKGLINLIGDKSPAWRGIAKVFLTISVFFVDLFKGGISWGKHAKKVENTLKKVEINVTSPVNAITTGRSTDEVKAEGYFNAAAAALDDGDVGGTLDHLANAAESGIKQVAKTTRKNFAQLLKGLKQL